MQNGFIQVYTGDGKGKTTAAFGLALRALGRNMNVTVVQFLKSHVTGELLALSGFENFKVIRVNSSAKFSWKMNESELQILNNEMQTGFQTVMNLVNSSSCDILILDEINHAIHKNQITKQQIELLIASKPQSMELVFTGRNAPEWLINVADLVTEMKCIKHPHTEGVKSRIGIEN